MYVYMNVCMQYMCMYVCAYVCVCRICVCMYAYVDKCARVCVCACMCLSLINTSDVVPINRIKWNTQHTGKLVLNVRNLSQQPH